MSSLVHSTNSRDPPSRAMSRVLCAAILAQNIFMQSFVGASRGWGASGGLEGGGGASDEGGWQRSRRGAAETLLIRGPSGLRGGGMQWRDAGGEQGKEKSEVGGMVWGKDTHGFPILLSGKDVNKTEVDRNHEARPLQTSNPKP